MKRLALLALLAALPAWSALPTATVFEVHQAGSNSNPGCFIEGSTGTDFSQQNSAQYTFTDLVVDLVTNTKVTSASHNFVSTDVGNCLRITAGTGYTTGVYYIVSVAANAATLDRSPAAVGVTGGTFFVGGALATLAQLNTEMCSGCRAWVKADAAYVISSKITFNYSSSGATWIRGYTSTRGDGGRATIKSTGSIGGDRLVDLNVSQNFTFANFTFDVNGDSGVTCLLFLGQPTYAENIECKNFNYTGGTGQIQFNNIRGVCRNCWVHDGTASGTAFYYANEENLCLYCSAINLPSNGSIGFRMDYGNNCLFCLVANLAGANSDGFQIGGQPFMRLDNPVCYSVTRDCVRLTSVSIPILITNGIFVNATNGINNTSGTTLRDGDILNDYNYTFNMSGAAVVNLTAGAHSVTLARSPFVNAGSLDFRLNNNAGGGASVRAHGVPSSLPGVTGTYYPDAGIAQHQDPKFLGVF